MLVHGFAAASEPFACFGQAEEALDAAQHRALALAGWHLWPETLQLDAVQPVEQPESA